MRLTKSISLVLILLCALSTSAQQPQTGVAAPPQHQLIPIPASVQFRAGRLAVTSSFTVAVKGQAEARLRAGVDRAMRRLEGRTGLTLQRELAQDASVATLTVESLGPGLAVPAIDEDESYSLEVTDRQAVLKAPTVVGALRGLETLLQLLEGDRDGYFLPAVSIQDKPRFRWRGLLVDSARHFQPVEVIKRNLDGMAAVKLNVFHWHLTEDQGFRIESRKHPKLHLMGSDGLYYTQEQARDIIEYARERGIRVVPEFDMPGHATSWLVGYPELASAPGPYQIERQPGIMEPALDPTREEVYKFLDIFLGEMAALFPDAYMHIGGDENEGKQWNKNPQIQAFMKEKGIKDNHALQAYFNQRISRILKKHGKRMVGWDEILHPDLPQNVVIQSWRGPASLAEAARKGYDGILSAGYYLDLMFPAANHYQVDPLPAGSDLSEQQAAHILGGEAAMWSEYVSPETIDSRIWPRLAAIAERLWSPRTVTDVDDMYRRLAAVSIRLEELGLTHKRNKEVLLRRLANGHQTGPLETLVSILEPVKEYNRGRMHPTTMLSPLTSLVDAAHADADAARPFESLVDGLLSDAPRFHTYRENLRMTLTEWRDARPELDAMIARSPILRSAEPLAKDMSELGTAGLEALTYLSTGVTPASDWREEKLAAIEQAAKPKAALEFVVIHGIKKLIIAAAELPQLRVSSPAEWQKRIKALATTEQSKLGK
ncbi:MAG TPA: family 20 glycosylhydrolase [Pyrinomonadaceae bacterium]|nr:family 20 glycosylhydrolase [Pyrinomonadaceae bacterium]